MRHMIGGTLLFVVGACLGYAMAEPRQPTPAKESAQGSVSKGPADGGGTSVSERQFKGLTRRLVSLENRLRRVEELVERTETTIDRFGKGPGDPDGTRHKPRGAMEAGVADIVESLRSSDSEVRNEVTQIVRDEFQNMRSEWRAYRNVRGEVRDEEFLRDLSDRIELSESERDSLSQLLIEERTKRGEIRRKARETFDIRTARDEGKMLRAATEERAKKLLGEQRYEKWQSLREERRPPWRR